MEDKVDLCNDNLSTTLSANNNSEINTSNNCENLKKQKGNIL